MMSRFVRFEKESHQSAILLSWEYAAIFVIAISVASSSARQAIAQTAPDKFNDHAKLRFKLAKAQNELIQPKPPLDSIIDNCNAALRLEPKYADAFELLSMAQLLKSRSEETRKGRLDYLTVAIANAQSAIDCSPQNAGSLASANITLSSACVELANYDKKNRDLVLKKAADAAEAAEKALADQTNASLKDYPFLAQGNAFEDLAWLCDQYMDYFDVKDSVIKQLCNHVNGKLAAVTQSKLNANLDFFDKSQKNRFYFYLRAINAFQKAETKAFVTNEAKALAQLSIGRCLRRMAIESWLYPGLKYKAERDNLLKLSLAYAKESVKNNPQLAEAHYQLGILYLSPYSPFRDVAQADKAFLDAINEAKKQGLSSHSTFALAWVQLPMNEIPDGNQQKTLARINQVLLQKLPPPPGESFDLDKEMAVIRGNIRIKSGEFDKARMEFDTRLPANLDNAQPNDYSLLVARAVWKRAQIKQKFDLALAKSAIADANRADSVAILPECIARARGLEGELHYLISINNNNAAAELAQAQKCLAEAKHDLPRSPDDHNWSAIYAFSMYDENHTDIDRLMNVVKMQTYSYELAIQKTDADNDAAMIDSLVNSTNQAATMLLADFKQTGKLNDEKRKQILTAAETWKKLQDSIPRNTTKQLKALEDSLRELTANLTPPEAK